jgi:long-chain acyl-CoA synthetase
MQTIISLFEDCAAKYSNNVFILEKKNGQYKGYTYREILSEVYKCAAGLISIGIKKGDRIALLSEGRRDWVISELGILYAGAINVPLSIKLTEPEEIKFRIEHSGSRMIIVSRNQAKKIIPVKNKIKCLEKFILLDPEEKYGNNELLYSDIIKEGEKYLEKHEEEIKKRSSSVKASDYANITYTSGTTADPKGIILSHRNYTANVEQSLSLFSVPDWWTTLLILPWDHSFAHTCGIYTLMSCGASMASVHIGRTPMETLKNIPVNMREIRPCFLLSVPALAKNFRKNIEKGISEKGPVIEKLFKRALKLAYSYNRDGWNRGKGLRILKKPLYSLYDKLIFRKIREGFGGRLEFFVGGGALLDIELQRFFYAIGMPMYQGYGLSEAAPSISANNPKNHKMGSSGKVADNILLKICDEKGNQLPVGEKGEIVIKGENVMVGYWNNEKATQETIRNGWLHTGDLGYLDKDGFLYVLGRTKSLLIADDGEKYSPEGIEEAMTEHSGIIEQCMLFNNQRAYTIILLYPNKEAIKKWVKTNKIDVNITEGEESVLRLIEGEINKFRTEVKYATMFPQRWLPAAIGILDEGFTEENHLLNSTLKMVRGKITERYKELIEYLYTPEAKNICNPENIKTIRKLLSIDQM